MRHLKAIMATALLALAQPPVAAAPAGEGGVGTVQPPAESGKGPESLDDILSTVASTDAISNAIADCVDAMKTGGSGWGKLDSAGWIFSGASREDNPDALNAAVGIYRKHNIVLMVMKAPLGSICRIFGRIEKRESSTALRSAITDRFSAVPLPEYRGEDSLKASLGTISAEKANSILISDSYKFRIRDEDPNIIMIVVVPKTVTQDAGAK